MLEINRVWVKQGKPFYFIEMMEGRSINSNGKGRGKIGTLLIMNYNPKDKKIVGDKYKRGDLIPCNLCGIYIQKKYATQDRYIKGKPYCLSCIKGLKRIKFFNLIRLIMAYKGIKEGGLLIKVKNG